MEITEGEDFDEVLSVNNASVPSSAEPVHHNLVWFFAVAVLLVIIAFVIYGRS